MRIVLIGADGQLGTDLAPHLEIAHALSSFCYPELDITQTASTRKILEYSAPDLVINTAAYNLVDEAEERPRAAFQINATAVRSLAQICCDLNAILVHFSSDYVFDGRRRSAYTEEDSPNPLNVYGVSKLAGEYFVRHIIERHYIVRTCGLYGKAGTRSGHRGNFVEAILRKSEDDEEIRVVNDQWVSPTSTAELAAAVAALIQTDRFGTYHLTSKGACTWFEFAQEILRIKKKRPRLSPIATCAYGARAVRPRYSVLDSSKARKMGLPPLSHWKSALEEYLTAGDVPVES